MSMVVFAGPTITAPSVREIVDATLLPPARQGDVYRALQAAPRVMCIIDGYFDRVPAVWHKEILLALQNGVHVFGGASMGALRAVELESFGMVGVGAVFEAFRSGAIEDDDEVAVAHGPAADGYRPLSEATVNVRATLAAALRAGVIGAYSAQGLLAEAKALPYEERNYATIIAAAARRVPAADLARFGAWWPTGRVNQKQRDAISVLEEAKRVLDGDPEPKRVRHEVEETDAWREACEPLRQNGAPLSQCRSIEVSVLEELQVGGHYPSAFAKALTRALILDHATGMDGPARSAELNDTLARFCRERSLAQGEELARWRARQGLEEDVEFLGFLRHQSDVYRAELLWQREARRCLPDQLRAEGAFGRLRERAGEKAERLRRTHLDEPMLSDTGMTEDALWAWYFREVLRTEVPDSIFEVARRFGFEDVQAFRAVVIRERLFRHGNRPADGASA